MRPIMKWDKGKYKSTQLSVKYAQIQIWYLLIKQSTDNILRNQKSMWYDIMNPGF